MSDPLVILGIESSCDETGCALVADGRTVLANVVASQIDMHARFGGVVPEIASRAHVEAVNGVIERALAQAGVAPAALAAVAVTNEPGLIGSVLVGLMAAKTLAWTWERPLIGVNHVYAHAVAAGLDGEAVAYPAVALICSGGHTALYRCEGPTRMTLLGTTIDDAAGEAFDKAAKILHLSYPGGPAIQKAAEGGDAAKVPFPRSLLRGASLDFSFSGLKTALLYHVNGVPGAQDRRPRRQAGPARLRRQSQPHAGQGVARFTPQDLADVAASFQAAIVDTLRIKLRRACEAVGARTIILGGGVAANAALRAAVTALAGKLGIPLRLPKLAYCLDNAAMVAAMGYYHLQEGKIDTLELEANATVRG